MVWLEATNIINTCLIFNFSGQAKIDTFAIDFKSLLSEQRRYDVVMVNKYRLSLEAVRLHSNDFPYWQHRKSTGRPPVHERDLLIAFLVRQLFDATFRETEGLLVMLAEYFDLEYVPDHSVLCKKNASHSLAGLVEEVLLVRAGATARTYGRGRHRRFRLQRPEAVVAGDGLRRQSQPGLGQDPRGYRSGPVLRAELLPDRVYVLSKMIE